MLETKQFIKINKNIYVIAMKSIILLVPLLLCQILADDFSEWKCENGVRYIENDCNSCWCDNDNMACHRIGCSSHALPIEKRCDVGTTWQEGCNTCWCFGHSGKLCTTNKEC